MHFNSDQQEKIEMSVFLVNQFQVYVSCNKGRKLPTNSFVNSPTFLLVLHQKLYCIVMNSRDSKSFFTNSRHSKSIFIAEFRKHMTKYRSTSFQDCHDWLLILSHLFSLKSFKILQLNSSAQTMNMLIEYSSLMRTTNSFTKITGMNQFKVKHGLILRRAIDCQFLFCRREFSWIHVLWDFRDCLKLVETETQRI